MILKPDDLEAIKKKHAWLKTTDWFQNDWSIQALIAHAEVTVGTQAKIIKGHVDAPAPDTYRAWELGCTCRPCKVVGERRPLFYELSSDCPIHYLPLVEEVYIRLGSPLSPPSLSGADWTAEALRLSGLPDTKEGA